MVLRPPPPPGLLVAEARAPVTQVPVQGFSALPEAGWGQEWGCHGLNSDPPDPPNQHPLGTWPHMDMWSLQC